MALDNPLVSVVIPVYNRASSIADAIHSALTQSCQSLEVIAVDDGSTDDSAAAIFAIDDPRIRYVRQDNAGANVARNHGIALAQGRYVALLDSDDRFLPGHLERAIGSLGGNDAIYYARVVADRGDRTFLKPPRGVRPGEPLSEYLCCDAGFIQTSTLVLPAHIAKIVKYLDWLPYGQDVDYALRLGHAGYPFYFSVEPGAIWNDVQTGKRISSVSRGEVRDRWVNENREMLTTKAYLGFRGWRSAKAYAEQGAKIKALGLFLRAVAGGSYSPRHAARIFLQIILAGGLYQKLAGVVLRKNVQ